MDSTYTIMFTGIGIVGAVLFYGRFYVQWIVSEMKGRSVVPVAFWYMSCAGSLMLLTFAVWSRSPLGALGQNINIVIYTRNLVHIWRKKKALNPGFVIGINIAIAIIAIGAAGMAGLTWWNEREFLQTVSVEEARTTWLWLGIGVAGQGLFFCRFFLQWITTELKKESVIPMLFWPISVAAATLQGMTFLQRQEWLFAIGTGLSIVIYLRNMVLIRRETQETD